MRLVFPISLLIALSLGMSGCNRPPELEAAITDEARAAPRPKLTDNRIVLIPAGHTLLDEETQARMTARAGALKDRAEAVSGPVIAPAEAQQTRERAARLRRTAAQVAQDD